MQTKLLAIGLLALLAAAYLIASQDYVVTFQEDPEVPSFIYDGFTQFSRNFNKKYASPEEKNYRLNVYYKNFLAIMANNQDQTKTYQLGQTQFMDFTQEEFVNLYLMKNLADAPKSEQIIKDTSNLTGSADWRGKAVTGVKNQGSCGSCWAFSTVGALEGFSALKGKIQEFSEQQLVDCAGSDGAVCYGCNGGWPNQALGWVKAHGITSEKSYPYKAVDQKCKQTTGEFHIAGVVDVPESDDQLKAALEAAPISVCIDASNWFLYTSGVFNNCGTNINHAVTLVAYDDSQWVLKNSWATTWGEDGFIRLAAGNTCGIYSHATYPV